MKKKLALFLVFVLAAFALAACGGAAEDQGGAPEGENGADTAEPIVLKVGASPVPHAEILEFIKPILAEEGIDLQVTEYTDYVIPNTAVESRELDANYFQHLPYLNDFNAANGTNLVSVVAVHYEPFGIYPGKTDSLESLKDGAVIAVPNDTTNEARALQLLEQEGLIKLKAGVGLTATPNDIVDNPKNIQIFEVEAAAAARSTQDADLAAINGNYALAAGFTAADALAFESAESEGAQTYGNIIAVYEGDESRPEIQALVKVLTSEDVRAFIEDKYEGSVVPVF